MNNKTLGIALILIGIIMMMYTGFNYVTTEKLVEIGPIVINTEKNHPVHWTPYLGVLLIIGGVIVVSNNKLEKE